MRQWWHRWCSSSHRLNSFKNQSFQSDCGRIDRSLESHAQSHNHTKNHTTPLKVARMTLLRGERGSVAPWQNVT